MAGHGAGMPLRNWVRATICLSGVAAGWAWAGQADAGEAVPHAAGAAIYEQRCVRCHGAQGKGVAGKYDEPLYGSRSIESLARRIERTMPEDDPGTCVGEDARQVAEYIYHEFYSLEARQRKGLAAAPRVELARLTVGQFRNAVADLLGQFTPAAGGSSGGGVEPAQVEPGLRGEYFQSKGMSKADNLALERVDRRIDFNFGEGSPDAKITADQFAIIWQGALLPRHTGHFEFRVRSENGVRVYLNLDATERIGKLRDDSSSAGQAALIDGWVGSGVMREREHTARVYLLGGRSYPFRVEFFKYKEKTASIKVEWKPPHGAWSVLDESNLATETVGRTFVLETPFPADDRSLGYERGRSVTPSWYAAVMNAAAATAAEVVDRLPLLAGFREGDPRREERIKEFVARFARLAFRRPLTEEEDGLYRKLIFKDEANLETGVRRAVILILMSPGFLYTDLAPAGEMADLHGVAARLAWVLWDSIPDTALIEAAESGQLASAGAIEDQARRMILEPRAKAKVREFFAHWLELEERDLAKDQGLFPEFDEAVIADLRRSLETFTEDVFWSGTSDYRDLLLADYLVLNGRLRSLYDPGAEDCAEEGEATPCQAQPQDEFRRVSLPGQRAGVLTHPYLLSAFAYPNNTSPIHRGVFLTRNIIGRLLKPPPMAVAFKDEEFSPDSTMREKVTQLTRATACMACHSTINPLGFALENFDAVGRWRTTENDKPVDTRGSLLADDGSTVELASALDVARFAVESEAAHGAFVSQLFHHLVKEDASAYGPGTLDTLRRQFEKDGYSMKNLMVQIAVLAASHGSSIQVSQSASAHDD